MRKLNKKELYLSGQEHADLASIAYGPPRRRYREQEGEVIQHRDGSWHLRYYVDDPTKDRGRAKISEPLNVPNDADRYQRESAQKKRMAQINEDCKAARRAPEKELTIDGFFNEFYLPWMRGEGNLRWTTWRGAEKRYHHYVKGPIGDRNLRRFSPVDANAFLSGLARKRLANGKIGLSVGSLQSVRAVLSGIFSIAASKGFVQQNPILGLKVTARPRKSAPTIEYTPEEMDAILNAIPSLKGKLFFAFCAYAGMRPSEVAALKWDAINERAVSEDAPNGVFEVRDAAASGHEGGLKTEGSRRTLAIFEPIKGLLAQYRSECKKAEGYLFERKPGKPVNHNNFVYAYVKPYGEKACARWCGCYAARRGYATDAYAKRGDLRAVYQVLGNTWQVAAAKYVKPSVAEGRLGQAVIEADYLKRQAVSTSQSASQS